MKKQQLVALEKQKEQLEKFKKEKEEAAARA